MAQNDKMTKLLTKSKNGYTIIQFVGFKSFEKY